MREERGWSQRELARRARVSPGIIAQIEAADVHNPGIYTLEAILRPLGSNLAAVGRIVRSVSPRNPKEEIQTIFATLSQNARREVVHRLIDAL